MKSTQTTKPDELRMKSADFDNIMRGALGVAAPPVEPKKKATPKKRTAAKKATKRV